MNLLTQFIFSEITPKRICNFLVHLDLFDGVYPGTNGFAKKFNRDDILKITHQ
jgi:hypothetical protein